ncbi:MAG: CPBP family intramembrane metalloprotease [Gracilibacteraceae bacterium]|jgi:membrane protease YdiL (CAAX protease family)|nr:CPBP family intramembrane metalloprotease [Gracilibacteraceae bacterium]
MDNKKRKVKTVQDDGVPSSAQSSLPTDMETSPTDMETPRWNMWQAAFVLLLYCLVQVILGWDHSAADLSSHEIFFAYIFAQGGKFVLGVGLVWVGLLIVRGSWEQLGVGRFRLRHLLIGLAAGVGLAVVVTVTMNLLAWVLNAPESQPIALALLSLRNPWEIVLLAVCSVVLAPMLEELLFRGMLYPPLRVVCSPRLAVCLVALIFAAFHFDFLRFIPLFVGAVGLTLLLEKTRSLWPGIVAHGVWNLIMVVVVLLQRGNGYA